MKYYRVHVNDGNAAFVKEESFFRSQGGLTQKWGLAWKRVKANSIEDARKLAHRVCK